MLAKEQGGLCFYCHVVLTYDTDNRRLRATAATLDHKIPYSKGGPQHLGNLVVACHRCNAERKDTPFDEFLDRHVTIRCDGLPLAISGQDSRYWYTSVGAIDKRTRYLTSDPRGVRKLEFSR